MDVSVEIKQKLLGSIFPAKLRYCDGSYRTTSINPALSFILQKNKVLENEKTGQELIKETLSGDMPRIGLEPTYLSAPDPKSGVSTNFTTWAKNQLIYLHLSVLVNMMSLSLSYCKELDFRLASRFP